MPSTSKAGEQKERRDIFQYITIEENVYQQPIDVIEGYSWNMKEHIRLSALYKNSQYSSGKQIDRLGNMDDKPFKNIIRPIINLAYRSEGFAVKDISLFINKSEQYFKSLLVRKYHNDKWAAENNIDTLIDDVVESYIDYGGALIKNVKGVRPELVPLQSLAFCDQTNLLAGPFAIKHYFSPSQLMSYSKSGWGDPKKGADIALDELVLLGENRKVQDKTRGQKVVTPGRYIEVYEVHGEFPEWWLDPENGGYDYSPQLHIVSYYRNEKNEKVGVTLYKGKEPVLPFKLVMRDKVFGRALGFGGIEELFEDQVWTNYDIIRVKGLLDAAAKQIYQTTDQAFATRNVLADVDNGEILSVAEGHKVEQIQTSSPNINLFERSIADWEQHARVMGSASDSMLGRQATHIIPFRLQLLMNQESHSLHDYRKGKLATFFGEVYRDWIIPHISREITKDQQFLANLDMDELQTISDNLVTRESNKVIKEKILSGELINSQEIDSFKKTVRDRFMKGGSKRFVKILENEMKDAPIEVQISIADKQRDLTVDTDKLFKVFQQVIAAPQVLQDPRMAKIFNQILEYSGLSPVDFGAPTSDQQEEMQEQQQNNPQQQPNPMQRNAKPMQQEQNPAQKLLNPPKLAPYVVGASPYSG